MVLGVKRKYGRGRKQLRIDLLTLDFWYV